MNKITIVTRQNIADEIKLSKIDISGSLNEADFLARLYDLNQLPSLDYRYENAYVDIYSHSNWGDYEPGWMFGDARFNLLYCDDETFKKFLCETVHPTVCNDSKQATKLIDIYNKRLRQDGFEMSVVDYISSMPVYSIREINVGSHLTANKEAIRQFLNTDYVRSKFQIMTNAIDSDTDLVLGTAKELIETICKSEYN